MVTPNVWGFPTSPYRLLHSLPQGKGARAASPESWGLPETPLGGIGFRPAAACPACVVRMCVHSPAVGWGGWPAGSAVPISCVRSPWFSTSSFHSVRLRVKYVKLFYPMSRLCEGLTPRSLRDSPPSSPHCPLLLEPRHLPLAGAVRHLCVGT